MDDHELLDAYVREGSEEAFATLVERYLDLVYSAASRQLSNPDQAQDVTQAVFVMLSRKAGSISRRTVLSGWLYRTARYVALEAARAENRRRIREATMAEMSETTGSDSAPEAWKRISPHLDRSMDQLKESERNAILLRFFQGKSFREISATLGIGENAAKKRVGRAIDRLRQSLIRHGIKDSSAVLGAALTAFAIQPTPSAIASLIPAAVCHGTATAASVQILTEGALQMITWTKMKTTAACVAALLVTAGTTSVSVYHAQIVQNHAKLQQERREVQTQSQQEEQQNLQMLAALQNENQQLRTQSSELSKLRNVISQLQNQQLSLASTLNSGKLNALPPSLRESAEALRELQFVKFLAAGHKAYVQAPLPEEDRMEYNEEINLMKELGLALRIYATDHGDEFPERLDQLQGTGLLSKFLEERLQDTRYEYLIFEKAESKPGLPAVWWRLPDQRGIRLMVLNDGSAQIIREPIGVETPGFLPGRMN